MLLDNSAASAAWPRPRVLGPRGGKERAAVRALGVTPPGSPSLPPLCPAEHTVPGALILGLLEMLGGGHQGRAREPPLCPQGPASVAGWSALQWGGSANMGVLRLSITSSPGLPEPSVQRGGVAVSPRVGGRPLWFWPIFSSSDSVTRLLLFRPAPQSLAEWVINFNNKLNGFAFVPRETPTGRRIS